MSGISFSIYFEINDLNYTQFCSQVQSTSSISFNYENSNWTPIVYTSQPTFQNSLYVPPPESYAYYNLTPFSVQSISTIPYNSDASSRTLPIIYQINYNFLSTDLTSNIQSQLYDLLNVYNSILGSSITILTTSQQNTNYNSINYLVSNFCTNSQEMDDSICSSSSLNFPNLKLTTAPCINPYSNCDTSWNNYCFNDMNYDSEECLNYYQNSYTNNSINPNIRDKLSSLCSSIYNSNTTQSETFWDVCSCFLPDTVYEKFQDEYKLTGLTLGPQQCWYPRCMLSNSIKPSQSPNCPNSTVTTCLQNSYNDLIDDDGNIDDNTFNISQAIGSCSSQSSSTSSGNGGSSSGGNGTNSSNTSSSGNSVSPSSSGKVWKTIIIIISLVVAALLTYFFIKYLKKKIPTTTNNNKQNSKTLNSVKK